MTYIALIILTFGFFAFVVIVIDSKRIDRALRKQYDQVRAEIKAYEERTSLLTEHVHDYYNSLANTGKGGLHDMQRLQENLSLALEQIGRLLGARKYHAAEDMMLFLQGEESLLSAEWQEKTGVDFAYLRNWQERLEIAIQTVGKDIATASASMKRLGVTKTRGRQPTLLSLEQAKIHLKENLD